MCQVLPIDIWNEISYFNIYVYHTLALAIKGLERDINRRKCHFAVLQYYINHSEYVIGQFEYSILTLNGQLYCDDRPTLARQISNGGPRDLKVWIRDYEIHRTDGPAIVYGPFKEYYIHGIRTDADETYIIPLREIKVPEIGPLRINIPKFLDLTGNTIDNIWFDHNQDIFKFGRVHSAMRSRLNKLYESGIQNLVQMIDFMNI